MEEKMAKITDNELARMAESALNKLCETGGRSFRMCVPPQVDDTYILFYELIDRFKAKSSWVSVTDSLPDLLETVWLTTDGKRLVFLGCRVAYDDGWHWAESNGVIYGEDGKIISECESEDLDVMFWRELPKLPVIEGGK